MQYGSKTAESYWPNGMDLIKKFVNNNNADSASQITTLQSSTANKEKDSLSTSNAFDAKDRDNIRNILMIHKALDQAGFYFPDLSQEIMRAAVNINNGPVKFEFDLRDPIEIQTKDGGEAKIKIKGDITFTKNGKEIQLNYGNTSLSLTHLINGEEEEIKQKLDKSNNLVQTMAIEFEKTKVKISYDKLWSTLSSDGTTFSQGTHQEGDKVYLRFKYESPELETALPPDPLGNTWSSKMHGWAVTIDYRPGKLDNKNDLDDLSGLAPEYVLTDYYYQVLAAKKAAALAGNNTENDRKKV